MDSPAPTPRRTDAEKTRLFRERFSGLARVYGSYRLSDGRAYQVKAPVTDEVIYHHLTGRRPYGVYLLMKDKVRATAVDFDEDDVNGPIACAMAARRYGIAAHIERSKSKGYHVWVFFPPEGVLASKMRKVLRHICEEIGHPTVEIFPKQDTLSDRNPWGNFINAPLFAPLVKQGRTVFLDPNPGLTPYSDQWDFLSSIEPTTEQALDEIIGINGWDQGPEPGDQCVVSTARSSTSGFGLLPCTARMLAEGVEANQRLACFWLAIHLKRIGLPQDYVLLLLREWATRNRPHEGKRIITDAEVVSQTTDAFRRDYTSCGCDNEALRPFCADKCPIKRGSATESQLGYVERRT